MKKALLFALILLATCSLTKVLYAKELNVYNWGAYIGETTIQDFEKSTGIKVNYSTYSSNEEMLGKLLSSEASYDVVFPSDYMVKQMIDKDLLHPINFALIPNIKNIDSKFKNLPFDPESKFSVPYLYGTCGIGYNKKMVNDRVSGFGILANKRYKNKIIVLDDMRFTIGAALKYLGFSANSTNPNELDRATALLIEIKKNIHSFSVTNYIDLLANEKVSIAFGYSAGVFQARVQNPSIEYAIPSEGAIIYVDNVCIPKNAQNIEEAALFINFILDAKNSAQITNTVYSASPNEAALPFINKEIQENTSIFPDKETLQKSEFLKGLGDVQKEYEKRWVKIKR